MNFKHWPYWVKGGFLGILYSLVVFALAGILKGTAATFSLFFFNIPALFILGVFYTPLSKYENIVFLYVAILLTNAAITAFIGYLYGKFKNRQKVI